MNRRGISTALAHSCAGQTLAEFAMTSSVFLLLLFAIMETALAVNAYNNVSTAAREAARYAMVHSPTSANSPCPASDCSAVQQQAVNYAPFLALSDVAVTFTNPTTPTQDYAEIQITHTYPLNIPFMSAVNLHLSASSQMLVSQ
jgi:Flp pilus assembly protein TadG